MATSSGTPPHHPTLRDPAMESALVSEGYAVFRGALSTAEVERLRSTYKELGPHRGEGFETDFEHDKPEHKRRVDAVLRPFWQDLVAWMFLDHRVVFSSYLMKWPGAASKLALHDDWTFVDESEFRSVALWVALDDTSRSDANGPLSVVPRSHTSQRSLRGTNIPSWCQPYEEHLERYAKPLEMDSGDAVVLDNRILHMSFDNFSGRPRLAVAAAVVPCAAALWHVVSDESGLCTIFEVDTEFFLDYSPARLAAHPPTDLAVVATSTATEHEVSPAAVAELCDGQLPPAPSTVNDEQLRVLDPEPDRGSTTSSVPHPGSGRAGMTTQRVSSISWWKADPIMSMRRRWQRSS